MGFKPIQRTLRATKKGGLDAINNFSFISNKSILDIGYGDEKTTTEIAKKMSK